MSLLQVEFEAVLVWGAIATAAMGIVLEGSHYLRLSRMSLPFMVGTAFSESRRAAALLGFVLYVAGGWAFALLYAWAFETVGAASWWLGAAFGLLHGLFLLIAILPLLALAHPRMATEYDGPSASRRLEPPGFMALNYGQRTPVITLAGQILYGTILGAGYPVG